MSHVKLIEFHKDSANCKSFVKDYNALAKTVLCFPPFLAQHSRVQSRHISLPQPTHPTGMTAGTSMAMMVWQRRCCWHHHHTRTHNSSLASSRSPPSTAMHRRKYATSTASRNFLPSRSPSLPTCALQRLPSRALFLPPPLLAHIGSLCATRICAPGKQQRNKAETDWHR